MLSCCGSVCFSILSSVNGHGWLWQLPLLGTSFSPAFRGLKPELGVVLGLEILLFLVFWAGSVCESRTTEGGSDWRTVATTLRIF